MTAVLAGSPSARTVVLLIAALATVGVACRASAQVEHVLLIRCVHAGRVPVCSVQIRTHSTTVSYLRL